MTAFVFGISETKMRCISPQVGGAFGTKIFLYPEYVLMAALAEKVGRPVKWIETRRENYAATTHGRDHISYLEVGATNDGTITALKVKTYANLGGVLSTIAPGIPTTLYGRMLSGAYRFPAHPLPGARRLHEHRHGRRLPRRRQARGDLRRRARDRPGRAGHQARPGGRAATQLHPLRCVPLRARRQCPERAQVRHRRLREDARPGTGDPRLSRRCAASRSRPAARAGYSASASRPTSRCAASLRRPGSAPSARAGAPVSGRAPTCAYT